MFLNDCDACPQSIGAAHGWPVSVFYVCLGRAQDWSTGLASCSGPPPKKGGGGGGGVNEIELTINLS